MSRLSLQALADKAEANLTPERFLHVLGVTHAAVALALRHGADPERAAAAALLHDRSKSTPPAEIEADLERRGLEIPAEDRPTPALWHGPHAAAFADEAMPGDESAAQEIARAVAVHSTADAAMSALAMILFVADYTEPCREYDRADEFRDAARRDLEDAFRQILRHKCRFMRSRGKRISPRALRALEYYGLEA